VTSYRFGKSRTTDHATSASTRSRAGRWWVRRGFLRYSRTMTDAQGKRLMEGIVVCEMADDGKLQRVVMFFGPLPERG
jgi:hypothetical protein